MASKPKKDFRQVTVWVHDDNFSKDEVLVAPDILAVDELPPNTLMEIVVLKPSSGHWDPRHSAELYPQTSASISLNRPSKALNKHCKESIPLGRRGVPPQDTTQNTAHVADPRTRYYFVAKPMPPEIRLKHPSLQVSITTSIANRFGYRQRDRAAISLADYRVCSASHVELSFRDEYLSRSDMWRLVRSELAGKPVHKGQKILFLGSIKAMVKAIYVHGRPASSAYFCATTVPVFRSESARYVLFIQMSREMWDFDSEGAGDILFGRVIEGLLPELFKKWVELEARHLVSIVLFGRLEYEHHALTALQQLNHDACNSALIDIDDKATYRDFYRVVVTDMASGQWTTILNELKKDFRVFLRDITLHKPREHNLAEGYPEFEADKDSHTRICGRPTSALRGNILEAINIASSQFASDHIDRDLVRTGISVIVITPGTGVFEVDRQLLNLTSENLTNNGIRIDLICLSKMPLHSVPLFKWLKAQSKTGTTKLETSAPIGSASSQSPGDGNVSDKGMEISPVDDSRLQSTLKGKAMSALANARWSFGIPQWIDVSYWTSNEQQRRSSRRKGVQETAESYLNPMYPKPFIPRVRMYELQMMGLMELGLANISIPYLSEGLFTDGHDLNRRGEMLDHHKYISAQFGCLATFPRPIPSPRSSSDGPTDNRKRGLLSMQAREQGDMYESMDAYDKTLFSRNAGGKATKSRPRKLRDNIYAQSPEQDTYRQLSHFPWKEDRRYDTSDTDSVTSLKGTRTMRSQATSLRSKSIRGRMNSTDSRISRTTSFALRGLGPYAPTAVASTEINIENAQAEHSSSKYRPNQALEDSSKSVRSPANSRLNRISILSYEPESSEPPDSSHLTPTPTTYASRPISIINKMKQNQEIDQKSNEMPPTTGAKDGRKGAQHQDSYLPNKSSKSIYEDGNMSDSGSEKDNSSPALDSDISPWVKMINPANPSKNHPNAAAWVGKWQHLFPRTPKASTVKWRSLCTPASMPLTTEDFPSEEELDQQYIRMSNVVSSYDDNELAEPPKCRERLLREMIGLRLSDGYQLVVGRGVAKLVGSRAATSADYFMPEALARDGLEVFMSMGNTIQKLMCLDKGEVQVTRFVRKQPKVVQKRPQLMTYSPVIRTILSTSYSLRTLTLEGFSGDYPWSLADSYLAGQKDDLNRVYEQLRFWRARFVVIPVEPPPSARRPTQSMSEDNEEEIHLLGIRELTKMWQKIRYEPPEQRRFKRTTGKRKDPNPLEIIFQTLNPSEVVATEIEKLLATDEGAETKQIQLLPDSELLERSTSSLSQIAQVLQGEKGVEIANRRWHLQRHYSCFKGDDFTNWLIANFKDIDSREEAVEFGNELMRHGLFYHVSTRHTFKDGNYFYTIAPEHRVLRPESRSSWFPGARRIDRSVPATPLAENSTHVSPLSIQSQPGLNSTRQGEIPVSDKGKGENRQVSVSLTKMMRIDVDHRSPKRSDRPEIVNLHYDRLHNPENCYHLELSWLNVTSKLLEDAIVNWATQSEKYGLRLVEVPIAEVCSITDREPFRAPYRIVLAVPPPPLRSTMAGSGVISFTNTLFASQTASSADKLICQKALLKKFNFVLDLEAASDFPADVDVTYTWGKLGYRYPQFVHRSGVILAQITDEGELLLLANRLYNTRSAAAKDAAGKSEMKNSSHHRAAPASGIVGLNAPNSSPLPSPLVRATSDVLGCRDALHSSAMMTLITPEQIKDELEEFCHDAEKLKAFYKEVIERGPATGRKSGSSSSLTLRPVPEHGLENSIPDLHLPASLVTTAIAPAKNLGVGLSKKNSPQATGRERTVSEAATTGFSHRGV